MSMLYRPVLIESAEQAEALPDGSMAYLDDTDAYGKPSRSVASKHRGAWWVDDRRDNVVGWTALVPIEAEEEHGARDSRYGTVWTSTHPRADRSEAEGEIQRSSQYGDPSRLVRRLITPWEDA